MHLYEMTEEMITLDKKMMEWAEEHEGDVSEFPLLEEMEKMEGSIKEKILNIGAYAKSLLAESEAHKAEAQKQNKWKDQKKKKAEWLLNYAKQHLSEGAKLEDERVKFKWTNSEKCIPLVEGKYFPEELQNVKVEPYTAEIKKLIKEITPKGEPLVYKNEAGEILAEIQKSKNLKVE